MRMFLSTNPLVGSVATGLSTPKTLHRSISRRQSSLITLTGHYATLCIAALKTTVYRYNFEEGIVVLALRAANGLQHLNTYIDVRTAYSLQHV
jgi:hypothetical protein